MILCALLSASGAALDHPSVAQEPDTDEKVLIVTRNGRTNEAEVDRIQKELRARLSRDGRIRTVVFQWESGDGDEAACRRLADFLFDELRGDVSTVSWIRPGARALGYNILAALACREIVLDSNVALAALPENAGITDPEFDKFSLELMRRHADHFLRPTVLVSALVVRDHDDIFRVEFPQGSDHRSRWTDNDKTIDFLTKREFDNLDRLDREGRHDIVCARGAALRLDATALLRCQFSRRKPAANAPDLLRSLELLDVQIRNVIDLDSGPLKIDGAPGGSLGGQAVIDFFHHPIVRTLLILGGFLGVLLEFKLLGTMIPGSIALVCFATLFVSSSFVATGATTPTATTWEIVSFIVGLTLVLVEFLMPTVGLIGLAGGAVCLVSLTLSLVPPASVATAEQMSLREAITTLILGFGIATIGFAALIRMLPRSGGGGLVNTASIEGVPNADNLIEAQVRTAALIGLKGVADTPLRPSGRVLLDDGRVLDVVSESAFVERGRRVVVTGGSGIRITVSTVDPRAEEREDDGQANHA